MNRKEKLLFAMVVLGSLTYAAWAANDTIGVTVGSGKVANLIKFATNVISETGICDATTENQCASVSAGGALSIAGAVTNAGTFATQSVVTGPGATGAALSGNPVRIGISDGTNVQNVLAGIALADGVNGNNQIAVTPWLFNGTTWDRAPGTTKGAYSMIAPDTTTGTAGTTAVAGTAASSVVGKASAGNLQNAYVTSSAAGWVFIINATSLPSNATLTIGTASGNLQGCFELTKGTTDYGASINYNPGPWEHFSAGVVVAISSTDCPVLTAASTGKFIHAQVN